MTTVTLARSWRYHPGRPGPLHIVDGDENGKRPDVNAPGELFHSLTALCGTETAGPGDRRHQGPPEEATCKPCLRGRAKKQAAAPAAPEAGEEYPPDAYPLRAMACRFCERTLRKDGPDHRWVDHGNYDECDRAPFNAEGDPGDHEPGTPVVRKPPEVPYVRPDPAELPPVVFPDIPFLPLDKPTDLA